MMPIMRQIEMLKYWMAPGARGTGRGLKRHMCVNMTKYTSKCNTTVCNLCTTQFQIEGGGMVQGVTKLITTFSTFVT